MDVEVKIIAKSILMTCAVRAQLDHIIPSILRMVTIQQNMEISS